MEVVVLEVALEVVVEVVEVVEVLEVEKSEKVALAMALLKMCGEMPVMGREARNEQDGEYECPYGY
jgi:thymidine phosphorylase